MPPSKLDQLYKSAIVSKYFVKGWGSPEVLKALIGLRKIVSNRESCNELISKNYPVNITKEFKSSHYHILEGYFVSPFEENLPGLLPPECKKANFQIVLPKKWSCDSYKPVCLHLAGTGDHYFWRRRELMAKPLLKEAGIGAILLENPFYGSRKPSQQTRSALRNVSDLIVMGACLMLESLVLFNWCLREGLSPLGITGMSMGGHMASLAATNWPHPIVLVPCLSWSTASLAFTEGVMSGTINWRTLRTQYAQDRAFKQEIEKMIRSAENDSFPSTGCLPMLLTNDKKNGIESSDRFATNDFAQKRGPYISVDKMLTYENSRKVLRIDKKNSGLFNYKVANLAKVKLLSIMGERGIKQMFKHRVGRSKTACDPEVFHFMKDIMDECTHLKNFSIPVDTTLITAVCALEDAYVPQKGVTGLPELWPGMEVKYLKGGHIEAFLLHQKVFRQAIVEGFERYKTKYIDNK